MAPHLSQMSCRDLRPRLPFAAAIRSDRTTRLGDHDDALDRPSFEFADDAETLGRRMETSNCGARAAPTSFLPCKLITAVTRATCESSGDGGSRTRSSSVQARRSATRASSPGDADGWSRTTTARGPVYSRGSSPMLSVRAMRGDRPGSNRRRGDHNPGCFRLHHGHHEAGTTGLEPAASRLTSERSALLSYAPERGRWKAGSAPRNRRQRRYRPRSPEPAVAHRRPCQRVSAPPPPHRLALEAYRSQLHVRARALHQPLFRHFLGPPVGGPILDGAGGIRTHDLELMRLARTAAPPPR